MTYHERDAWDVAGDSGNGIEGQHLKCAKGTWLLDDEEIETGDTYAVFSTQHTNLAPTGTVLSQDSLSAARLAMRKQVEMTGVLINVTPKFLLVPAALETLAEKIVTSIQATKTDDVNVMDFINVIVEPRLTSATAWYLAADPATIDGLEYCYLEGEAGPQTFSEIGFEVDGIAFKIREDFGGGWVEPRGWFKNPGA